ncbi:unnamed protein product [Aphanomyces euteiches]
MQDASMSSGDSSWAESSDSESDDAASDTHSASSQETTIIVRPDLISNDPTALIPCPPTPEKASFLWERAQISRKYSRKMPNTLILDHSSVITGDYQSVQGAIVHKYPNDFNIYTLLPLEDDSTDPFPAPFPIQIAGNPNVYSSIGRSVANLELYNTPNTDVESMTIEEVTDYLEQYANGFQVQDDPEQVVAMVQANPVHLAPLLDVHTPGNLSAIMSKLTGHTIQRFLQQFYHSNAVTQAIQYRQASNNPQALWAHVWPEQTQDIATLLFPTTAQQTLANAFALTCLYLQINQPEIYFNAIKVWALASKAFQDHEAEPLVATLTLTPHFLLSDATLSALAASELGQYLLSRPSIAERVKTALLLVAECHPFTNYHLRSFQA